MRVPGIIYAVLCGILFMIPLLNILHVESAAVIACASFFIAGLSGLHAFKKGDTVVKTLATQWGLLLIPLALFTVSMVWQANCGYGKGLLFFLMFPCITVFFAVCLAYAIYALPLKKKRTTFIAVGCFICIAGPVFDIGFHAQFFTYNHVFGGVMGPIYDEEIGIRRGLLAFRGLTVLWGILFLLTGLRCSARLEEHRIGRIAWVCVLFAIGGMYMGSAHLRINSPEWYIQQQLGGHLSTEHFDIYYSPDATSPFQLYKYAHDHEYRYSELSEQFGIEVKERIRSYIHPDPQTKEFLTGASYTNVAPVWLRKPQLHIYADVFDRVFTHELIHVFSREFGLPVINASLSIGLVEGLAVALEPSEGRPMPHEQVITAATLQEQLSGNTHAGIGASVEGSLSPLGFWTGRGAVSYTTMGSFVQYLITAYGIKSVMEVYPLGNFKAVYGKPVGVLATEWESYLAETPSVSRATHGYVTRRFAVPSLFERRCPHFIPRPVLRHRESLTAMAQGDTTAALKALESALEEQQLYQPAVDTWARIYLGNARPDSVIARIPRLFFNANEELMTPVLWMHLGDAYAVSGRLDDALDAYDRAQDGVPAFSHSDMGFLELRKVLAHSPTLLAILLESGTVEQKMGRLEAVTVDPKVQPFIKGLMLVAQEDFERAILYLESAEMEYFSRLGVRTSVLHRYKWLTLAELYYQTGQLEEALQTSNALEDDFLSLGALPEALLYADFSKKIRYITQRE